MVNGLTTEIVGTKFNTCWEIRWGGGEKCCGLRVWAVVVVGGQESIPGATRSYPLFLEEEGVVELGCLVKHLLPISHDGISGCLKGFKVASELEIACQIQDVEYNVVDIQRKAVAGVKAGCSALHSCGHEWYVLAWEV